MVVGVIGQPVHQRLFARALQRRESDGLDRRDSEAFFFRLRQHRTDARMGVLHVVHRILVRSRYRQVDVEHELGVGFA